MTFFLEPSIPLSRYSVVFDILDANVTDDEMIGTSGKMALEGVSWHLFFSGERERI